MLAMQQQQQQQQQQRQPHEGEDQIQPQPPSRSQAQAQTQPRSQVPPQSPNRPTLPLTSSDKDHIVVGGTRVYGLPIDYETRCVHWHGPVDIVALSLPCCDRYYPCADCHDAVTNHERTTWPRSEKRDVVLCGACGGTLTAEAYIAAEGCPHCAHPFNSRCALHRDKYFCPA